MKTTLADLFRKARSRAVPLIGIETADPAQTIRECSAALNGKADETPVATWDIVKGLTGSNAAGIAFCEANQFDAISTGNPSECLEKLSRMTPKKALIFFSNAHRFTANEAVAQGIWNLRDIYAASGATLVLLAPSLRLPSELARDVVIFTEPLPDREALGNALDSILADAALPAITGDDRARALDTMTGLSDFESKQAVALSLTKAGLDRSELWRRKVKQIEQTPGLQVWQGGESFADIGGLSNLKQFLTRVCTSPRSRVSAILYIDEIEKSLGGATGDSSGTSQDQLGTLLKVMQDENLPGIILLGHCGTGKSAIAKAAGTMAGAPVVACDLGAMKGSLVGQSEERIRTAMQVFSAISQGKGIVIATCNKISALPPELRRRFSLGIFMVDLPTAEEQKTIWPLWIKKYELDAAQPLPDCENWTGAEIKSCCDVAFRTGLSLAEASSYIVPVIKSAPEQIESLRKLAAGSYISASYAGTYKMPTKTTARQINLT